MQRRKVSDEGLGLELLRVVHVILTSLGPEAVTRVFIMEEVLGEVSLL